MRRNAFAAETPAYSVSADLLTGFLGDGKQWENEGKNERGQNKEKRVEREDPRSVPKTNFWLLLQAEHMLTKCFLSSVQLSRPVLYSLMTSNHARIHHMNNLWANVPTQTYTCKWNDVALRQGKLVQLGTKLCILWRLMERSPEKSEKRKKDKKWKKGRECGWKKLTRDGRPWR